MSKDDNKTPFDRPYQDGAKMSKDDIDMIVGRVHSMQQGIAPGGCVRNPLGLPENMPQRPTTGPIPATDMSKPMRGETLGAGQDGGGQRLNAGKTRLELVPGEWTWALADVTTKGSMKYPERNWEKGMRWSIMIGAATRHIIKFLMGERYDGKEFDKEKGTTGCHHLAMAAWNLLALVSYDLREVGENDLPTSRFPLINRLNAVTSDMKERVDEPK